jgi:hypothetical protein
MLRSVASKVMWVGRATVFLVGLAVVLALVVGVTSSAFAANGANLIIGNGLADTVKNIATLPTKLTMKGTEGGPALQVTQQSTNTGASGVGITVPTGKAPLAVNSAAGKATNLNADKLDGMDSSQFATPSRFKATEVIGAAPHGAGPLPRENTFTSSGGTLLLTASGSGFRNTQLEGKIGMHVDFLNSNGNLWGTTSVQTYTNEKNTHKAFVSQQLVLSGYPAGTYKIRLQPMWDASCNTGSETRANYCTSTDSNDNFHVTVLEIPS